MYNITQLKQVLFFNSMNPQIDFQKDVYNILSLGTDIRLKGFKKFVLVTNLFLFHAATTAFIQPTHNLSLLDLLFSMRGNKSACHWFIPSPSHCVTLQTTAMAADSQ